MTPPLPTLLKLAERVLEIGLDLDDCTSEQAYCQAQDARRDLRAALAALATRAQGEAVAWIDPMAVINFQSGKATKEWMWAKPDAGLVPVFAAPVASDGEVEALERCEKATRHLTFAEATCGTQDIMTLCAALRRYTGGEPNK